eukprot:1628788-Pleurochrysis_carterae.AAC.1
MQTDGSPPANDRLKSFALDKNELAKLLSLELANLALINFLIFATEASRRGKLMVMTNFERCAQSGRVPPGARRVWPSPDGGLRL